MRKPKKNEFERSHKHERAMLFLCFLSSALIGYFLTNHMALIGA